MKKQKQCRVFFLFFLIFSSYLLVGLIFAYDGYFGDANEYSGAQRLANYLYAFRVYYDDSAGYIDFLSFLGRRYSATSHVKFAVYSDNAGVPNTLLDQSVELTLDATNDGDFIWRDVDWQSSYEYTTGYYWIAFMGDVDYVVARTTATGSSYYGGYSYSSGFPSTYPSQTSFTASYSMVCYYNYSSPPPELENVTVTLDNPVNESTVTDWTANFTYTPVLLGSDVFHNSSLFLNGSLVASNSSVIVNNTLNGIGYTFSVNGTYLWDIQVWNSTTGVFSSNGNFTVYVGVYEPEPTPTPTPTVTPTPTPTGEYVTQEELNSATYGVIAGVVILICFGGLFIFFWDKQKK